MFDWQFAEAQNRFNEVVELALTEGPQRITHNDDIVVVLSEAEYEQITSKRPGIVEQFMQGPSLEGLDLTRDKSVVPDFM